MSFEVFFSAVFDDFINPSERLYFPVLVLSILFAWVILLFTQKNKALNNLKKNLFNKDILLHPSSIFDLKIFLLNNLIRFVFLSFFAGFLVSSHSVSVFFITILRESFGEIKPITTNWVVIRLSYTIFAFALLDFLRFFQHYLMHNIPALWHFHKVHHSAEVLTPLTLNRMHPVEMFIGMGRSALAIAISSSLYVFLFQVPLYGYEILGVNLFGFLFNALGANLRHSHFWVSFGILEYIFISPAQHQVHHSKNPEHYNKNLGICFSIWDILFGSFFRTGRKLKLEFGL